MIILPAMTLAEALETTRIHRVAGLTGGRTAVVTTRPCRAPRSRPWRLWG
jgi:magnesium chelatase family protein